MLCIFAIRPVLLRHLRAVGADPGDVLGLHPGVRLAGEEGTPSQNGVVLHDLDDVAYEVAQLLASFADLPVEPADLVVLAVGVVVAQLRAADLVATEQHGHALGEEQRGQEVALHAVARPLNPRRLGLALGAPVAAVVLVAAVVVVLAVGLVPLVLVGHQVGEGEAVVAGDEVDAGVGAASAGGVNIAGPGETRRQLGHLPGSPRQKRRTQSRKAPFHSDHPGGKWPSW